MSDKTLSKPRKMILKSTPVKRSSSSPNCIKTPSLDTPNLSVFSEITLVSKILDEWDPFVKPEKCIICWRPIGIDDPFMECPHCGQKGHQIHILNWLAKKQVCPYCREKW
ncbi:MAG: RING finger protein [Candidatus Hodarchaeales archaeon]